MEKDVLQIFLEGLLSPVGSGIFLWGFIAFVVKIAPQLSSEVKFWLTLALAFVIPTGAYLLQYALGYAELTAVGVFNSIGTGYMTSQAVHRGSEKIAEALDKGGA